MNKNARKWVRALLSGKYKQAKDQLRDGNNFCCLGVACDLYAKEKKRVKWNPDESFLGEDCELPVKVANWLGLTKTCGQFNPDARPDGFKIEEASLAQLNDRGWSFKKIADFIKNEPKHLFKKY